MCAKTNQAKGMPTLGASRLKLLLKALTMAEKTALWQACGIGRSAWFGYQRRPSRIPIGHMAIVRKALEDKHGTLPSTEDLLKPVV